MICNKCGSEMFWRPGHNRARYVCYTCKEIEEQRIRDEVAERIPGLGSDPNMED